MAGTTMTLGDFSADSVVPGAPPGQASDFFRRWPEEQFVMVVNPFRIEFSSMAPPDDASGLKLE